MYSELKQILVVSMSSYSEVTLITAASSNDHQDQESVIEDNDDTKQETCQSAVHEKKPRLLLGELNATDHEDDHEGFKTPTYNKIPAAAEIKKCPPAPRKPKPLASTKRKSPSSSSTSLRLDLSQEVNSLFPKPILDDLHRKMKKARRDN